MKFIFVSGGVISGVGKGISAASIGLLLSKRGFRISFMKCDPYINVDAGTMNPIEHGEVFVTDDGYEVDMDGGHYERFTEIPLSRNNSITTGQLYSTVIQNERSLKYDGECVEVIPHIRDEIVRRIEEFNKKNIDILFVEIGGTIGEFQNDIYYEAERFMKRKYGDDLMHIHIAYLPVPKSIGEMKTKPLQQSVMLLHERGIFPDLIIGRSELPIDKSRIRKIAVNAGVSEDLVFSNTDINSIYKVPIQFYEQKLDIKVLKFLKLKVNPIDLKSWKNLVNKIDTKFANTINVGIVGKYYTSGNFSLEDSYISVIESIKIACWYNNVCFNIVWIDSEKNIQEKLASCDCIIVPGGFGSRGIDGKIEAIKYAREHNIPFLGLCYGMQLAVVEYAQNVLGLKDANTTEINPKTKSPVVHIMSSQEKKLLSKDYGGSMRLGSWDCKVKKGTKTFQSYKKTLISERHRHRYEFNNLYRSQLENAGMIVAGESENGNLVEIIEIPNHKFFVGVQFHPEFKSRALLPHPLFSSLIKSAIK